MIEDIQTPTVLAREARQALRHGYVPEVGKCLSPTEQACIAAISKLVRAVELLDQAQEPPPIETTSSGPVNLEEIYASITGVQSSPGQPRKFVISFPEVTLSLDDIWPNKDAPDNPGPEDVIEAMRETEKAHPMTVATAWRLIDTLYVRHHGDDNGDMEVEWDGD